MYWFHGKVNSRVRRWAKKEVYKMFFGCDLLVTRWLLMVCIMYMWYVMRIRWRLEHDKIKKYYNL